MIVAVKRNRKQKIIKIVSLVVVAAMFAGYYFYMGAQFEQQQKEELAAKKAAKIEADKKAENKKNLENAILSEIEKAVDLVGQEYVKHVQIMESKLVMICEPKTNLEALMVRYGTMALVKNTLNEVIIAIDIRYIVESRLNAK